MKYLIFTSLAFLLLNCKQNNTIKVAVEGQTHENIPTWLIGDWEREGEKEGNKTYEYWRQDEDAAFIGMGCTLQGADTIWREDILLSEFEGTWKFDVIGLGDTSVTSFIITKMEKDKFTCENDLNEFPKKIEYAFLDNKINAIISGGGPTIPFNFRRMKQ